MKRRSNVVLFCFISRSILTVSVFGNVIYVGLYRLTADNNIAYFNRARPIFKNVTLFCKNVTLKMSVTPKMSVTQKSYWKEFFCGEPTMAGKFWGDIFWHFAPF